MEESEITKGHEDVETLVVREDDPPNKVDKKKRKKQDSEEAMAVSGLSGVPQIDERVSDRLLHLSVKSYKKLLVSMDQEEVWYEQVSNQAVCGSQNVNTEGIWS